MSQSTYIKSKLHSGRTLALKSTKKVEAVIQSIPSTTHSYTIQPTISASGKLLSPLFAVLKETSGEFGPRVQQTMFKPTNILATASTSGKLTNEHFKIWLKEVYYPNINEKTALLLDSWSGNCSHSIVEATLENKELVAFTIPAGITKYLQPLDVYGFRVWKNFVRRFSDTVILLHYEINLHTRDNILKLQSLAHNQFSSPRFENFIKYSWYKSGYVPSRPPHFENPVEFCYAADNEPRCHVCGDVVIIIWLCALHFLSLHKFK
ncbi:uncharacterized protein LOC143306005 [Osmia lignaria lignaria]|uniref:uncharacterized protein LOC143306005 n=1 Tax=Osmia lignaria lignaria TaxID=1437193 RepID=UPI00402BD586